MRSGSPRLGIHSGWDLEDPRAWSGVVPHIVEQVERLGSVHRLPQLRVRDALVDRLRARLSARPVLPRHSAATARRRSRALAAAIRTAPVDVLVAIAASTDLVTPSRVPLVQITDATFDAVTDFYPQFSGLSAASRRQGRSVERAAAARTAHFLVTSDWARHSLIHDVGVPADRITVAAFGPAITPPEKEAAPRPSDGPLELLLVASDWHRKNGDAAIALHAALRERRAARLTIVGDPPRLYDADDVRVLGRLEPERLSALYAGADVLLEPSRANASGVVITDALAHGLPVLAADVGGISTLLRPRIGGWLVPPDDLVGDAVRILGSVRREELESLSLTAAADARERLSWQAWGTSLAHAVALATASGPSDARRSQGP